MNQHTVLFRVRVHVQNRFVVQIILVLYRKIVDQNFHAAFVAGKMLYYMNVEMHEHYVV